MELREHSMLYCISFQVPNFVKYKNSKMIRSLLSGRKDRPRVTDCVIWNKPRISKENPFFYVCVHFHQIYQIMVYNRVLNSY